MAEEKEKTLDPVVLLHGDLDLKIVEARCLPNMDLLSERFRRCVAAFDMCRKPFTRTESYLNRRRHRKIITSDPYTTVCLAGATVARTRVISNSQNPRWNERFNVPLAHPVTHIEFHVKDDDLLGADHIGVAIVPAARLASGEVINEWFPIIGSNGKTPKPNSAIFLEIKFTRCEVNPLYINNIGSDFRIENCYFPMRHGGAVTLYQDAHVEDSMLPEIKLDGGDAFHHDKCWEDICHAILEAHHLVYIIGWSIYHKVKLVREPTRPLPNGGDLNLGELLKYKSQEGVRVLLLVWDDKTSHSKFFFRTVCIWKFLPF